MSYDVRDFAKDVISRSFQVPVLVNFWAEWCAPCKMLGPILEKLAGENSGRWELAKVNTEEFSDVAAQYRISSIPNVKLFVDGNLIAEFVGALPEYQIEKWLQKVLPSKYQQQLETVKQLLTENKETEAQKLLKEIIKEEPDNEEAKVLLAKVLLFTKPEEVEKLAENVTDPKISDLANSLQTLTRIFQLRTNPGLLPNQPTKQKYLSAIEDVYSQKFNDALEKLIDIIRSDRYYDDDGARKACIAIFKYLGEEHEITIKYRREFSSALYV